MAKYTTTSGQTIFDLSLQLYGNSSSVVKILSENANITSLTGLIPPGTIVNYTPVLGFTSAQFFTDKLITVNTGSNNPVEGSGFDLGFDFFAFK